MTMPQVERIWTRDEVLALPNDGGARGGYRFPDGTSSSIALLFDQERRSLGYDGGQPGRSGLGAVELTG